jgi:hypothetical protein
MARSAEDRDRNTIPDPPSSIALCVAMLENVGFRGGEADIPRLGRDFRL